MADTALGVLRRPTRPLEHRLERIARWRAQGLANGAADSTFPGDATDATVFASGGDATVTTGGNGDRWLFDAFDLESGTANSFALSASPIENSEVVRVNGMVLEPTEYTITGSTLELTDIAAVRLGVGTDTWRLVLNYAYYDLATPAPASGGATFGGFEPDGTLTLPTTPGAGDIAILITSGEVTGVSGAFTTWTKLYDDATGRDGVSTETSLWVGTDPSSGTTVTLTLSYTVGVYCAGVVFSGATGPVTLRDSAITNPVDITGLNATPTVTAVAGDIVVASALCKHDFLSPLYPSTPESWSEVGYTGIRGAYFGQGTERGTGINAGVASATTVGATFFIDGGPTGYTQFGMFSLSAGGAAPDPVIAVPGGTYTPPTPPSTPGTHVLRYQRPDTTGYTALDVAAGGTFNLDNTKDYAITASTPVTSDFVRLVGGRNLDIYGVVFDFSASVPTGSYDADRRGLHIKDGPNPNLKRVIYCEGVYLRSGYYSDGIQLALRHENDVTFICQALRSDAYGWGQRSGVHSDLIQFYGGPLNFLGDCITGKHQTYQGIFMRPADGRALPSGADKTDWQLSRVNLESSVGPDGTGAHYLLWDDQPAWTNLTLDEVYITGGRNDVTDGNGNIPSAGLHQNATPAGGDWAPSSWWPSGVYTSPGYV